MTNRGQHRTCPVHGPVQRACVGRHAGNATAHSCYLGKEKRNRSINRNSRRWFSPPASRTLRFNDPSTDVCHWNTTEHQKSLIPGTQLVTVLLPSSLTQDLADCEESPTITYIFDCDPARTLNHNIIISGGCWAFLEISAGIKKALSIRGGQRCVRGPHQVLCGHMSILNWRPEDLNCLQLRTQRWYWDLLVKAVLFGQ